MLQPHGCKEWCQLELLGGAEFAKCGLPDRSLGLTGLQEPHLEVPGLEACESHAHLQVQLLPGIHTQGFVLVRLPQMGLHAHNGVSQPSAHCTVVPSMLRVCMQRC